MGSFREGVDSPAPKSGTGGNPGNLTRQRSLSQKLSSSLDPSKLKRQVRPIRHSRVASESFIDSNVSGLYKGQVVGSPTQGKEKPVQNHIYLNHDDINRRAIQILHTEGQESDPSKQNVLQCIRRVIHPYDRFRRLFDMATVIWVLLLVYFIPLDIGFDWYEAPKSLKILFMVLDFWFAIDIVLNFRTGYIHHGTIVMDSKKIAS